MWFDAERDGQARQCRRRLDRLHASLRAASRSATCGAGWWRRRTPSSPRGDGDAARMKAKLVTGRFFMERMLPETAAHLAASRPARRARWNCRRRRSASTAVMETPADDQNENASPAAANAGGALRAGGAPRVSICHCRCARRRPAAVHGVRAREEEELRWTRASGVRSSNWSSGISAAPAARR